MIHPFAVTRFRIALSTLGVLAGLTGLALIAPAARASGGNVNVPWAGNGSSGLPYMAAPFSDGFALATIDQGNTSGNFIRIRIQAGTYTPAAGSGFRLKNYYGGDIQFGNCGTIVLSKDTNDCYVLVAEAPVTGTDPTGIYALPVIMAGTSPQQATSNSTYVRYVLRTDASVYNTFFGAATLPDNSGFILVAAKNTPGTATTATVTYFRWGAGADSTITKVAETNIALPTGVPSAYNGNIQCAVTHNFDSQAQYYPYRLTLATCVDGSTIKTREYRLNTKIFNNTSLSLAQQTRYFVTAVPGDNQWDTLPGTTSYYEYSLHTGLDGRAYLALVKGSGIPVFARTGYDANQAAVWQNTETLSTGQYGSYQAPSFVYFPLAAQGSPPDRVPIERMGLNLPFTNSSGQASEGYYDSFGYGKKIGLVDGTAAATSAGVVIGIVDGPPPIPNENLQLPGASSFTVYGKLKFAYDQGTQKSTTSSLGQGTTIGASASLGGEVEGFGAEAEVEKELSDKFTSTYSEENRSASETFLQVGTNILTDTNGVQTIEKKGTIFLARMSFSGYFYQFGTFDNNGVFTPAPGSLVFTQIFPKGGYNVEAQTFYMNPNGPQPGDILSYDVTPDELSFLNSPSVSKISFDGLTGNANYIYYQFNGGSSVQTAYDYFTSVAQDQAEEISTHEALKVSAKTPVAGASVSGAQDVDTTRTWSTGSDTHVGISLDMQIQNDSSPTQPVGNYYSYTVQTYLLKDSNAWLRELLSDDPNGIGMVTPTWPPIGSQERQRNEDLKAALIRTSTPWKVRYVVVNPSRNHALALAPSNGPTLQSALLAKLARNGVTTTGLMALALREWDAARRHIPANVVYPASFMRRLREENAQASTLVARYFPGRGTGRFQALVRSLTPAEAAMMRDYLARDSAATVARWTDAHPRRYSLEQTKAELARPDITVRRERFTEIPPAEPTQR